MNQHPSVRTQRVIAETLSGAACFVAAALLLLLALGVAGCGPTFDPPSLIESTRVVGARVEVAGAADRASPAPGETATVTWLMAAPGAMPALGWAFALCTPTAPERLSCDGVPMAIYQGTENPPRVTIAVPGAAVLGAAQSLILYGRICAGAAPTFDPRTGYLACEGEGAGQGVGTTASVVIGLATAGADANHNPIADRGLTFDGQPWTAGASDDGDPCATGPRVTAGSLDHLIAVATAGVDRERFTAPFGDPPVPTAFRESLQISQFTTAGKLKSPYAFIEGQQGQQDQDGDDAPAAAVTWNAPKAKEVTAETPVSFLFVVRDSRGGTDWTARRACVIP